jgi:hypothetical protein
LYTQLSCLYTYFYFVSISFGCICVFGSYLKRILWSLFLSTTDASNDLVLREDCFHGGDSSPDGRGPSMLWASTTCLSTSFSCYFPNMAILKTSKHLKFILKTTHTWWVLLIFWFSKHCLYGRNLIYSLDSFELLLFKQEHDAVGASSKVTWWHVYMGAGAKCSSMTLMSV